MISTAENGRGLRRCLRLGLILGLSVVLRLLVGFAPFSGEGKAGKGGDFEAQRHWMEITSNTPVAEWYVQTGRNSLAWWGLDYPPLSAYWAWAWGRLAQMVEPAWVELLRSRRCERQGLVLFMRLSVVLADVLCLLPALLLFARNRSYAFRLKLWLLSSPALLLVDHGHFQYNTLMLGLAVAGVVMLLDYRRPLVATALVCCSALFKQTGAYFVPAFAFYLLRQCIRRRLKHGLLLFLALTLTGLGTAALCLAPFLADFPHRLIPVLDRVFPVHRGLFEDKVANFWCALSILTKFDAGLPQATLVELCALTTLLVSSPALLNLLVAKPSANRFLHALAYTTLASFMFSYHVHEKSILVPQVPVLLLTHLSPVFVFWFSAVALLSLYQLVEKDELQVAYVLVATAWLLSSRRLLLRDQVVPKAWKALISPVVLGIYLMPLLQSCVASPARYPHLFIVLNTLACSGAFLLALGYLLYSQFTCESHYFTTPVHLKPHPH